VRVAAAREAVQIRMRYRERVFVSSGAFEHHHLSAKRL
jgi:RNase P/RNase MRP subunit p30